MQEGDVVVLRSGGPQMTITSTKDYAEQGVVYCRWFDEKGELHGQRLRAAALKLVSNVEEI